VVPLLLHVIFNVELERIMPEIDAYGLARVAQSDRGEDVAVFAYILEGGTYCVG
jgi:hypothetical protein